MKKLNLREKAEVYLKEIESGRLGIIDNWLIYQKIGKYNYVKKVGDKVGYEHLQCKGCWYCELSINNQKHMIAMSYIMFAYHYGIDSIHKGMEIRFRDGNMFNFSKENMIDASNTYGSTQFDLENSIIKRIEVMLKKITDGLYYVKNGSIYHNASGKNSVKDSVLGCLDDNGYVQHRISAYNDMYRVRIHQVLYAYYNGLGRFDENMIIHHKDGVKDNNKEDNLAQITQVENVTGVYSEETMRLDTKGKIELIIQRINSGRYEIDVNKGVLYNKISVASVEAGDIAGCIGEYHNISFVYVGEKYTIPLHNIIYYYVHGIEKYSKYTVIDHIDNIKLNNSINNLQQITHRENSKKGNRY